MGGPWRARGFDPHAWRPPAPHAREPGGADLGHDHLTGLIVAYIVAVATTLAVMLSLMKFGGW